MKNLKSTPGQWKISISGNPSFELCITTDKGGSVCHLTQWPEHEANARLISMAPEMAEEMIKDLKYSIESGCNKCVNRFYTDACNDCRKMRKIKIIEKATGLKIDEIIGD